MQTQLDTFYKQKVEAYNEQVQNQLLDTQWWTSNPDKVSTRHRLVSHVALSQQLVCV